MHFKYNNHNKHGKLSRYNILACSLIGLTTVSVLALLSSTVSADTTNVNTISTTVPASCSFTSTSTSSYGATILNGQSTTITADPITATCNDTAGYAVYAIGYSGDTYTGDYHTDMISTLNNSYNIKTNGTSGASYWKMKLQDLSNATIANSYNDFQVIPSDFTKVASYTSNTQAASFTPVYQIYIATTQAAGTYTGKVKYTLVHPSTMVAGTYNIAYNANGGTGTMTGSTGLYNFEEFTMPTSTFTAPSGSIFAGWCTTNTAGSYACDGTSYAAGDTVTSLATAGSTATLYAYWEEKQTYCTINSTQYCMQDVATWGSSLANNQEVTAMDSRDGKTYTVAKLADGNIWMTQNLDHDIKTDGSVTYDSTTTDISSAWAPSTATYATGTTTWNGSATAPESYDPGDLCWNGTLGIYNLSTGTTTCGDDKHMHIGNYYNWTAAVAMNDSSSYTSDGTDVNQSICPAGWMLPKDDGGNNTSSGTYYNLVSQYGWSDSTYMLDGYSMWGDPLYFPLSGRYWNGSVGNVGYYGYFWSSVVGDSDGAYFLDFDGGGDVSLDGPAARFLGNSVRCLARAS